VVRIDLREPTIRFLVTPSNGERPKDCDARTTSEFLAEFKCQVAINGSFFSPFAKRKGDPQDVLGLSMSRGDLYSPPNQYAALLIAKDNRARIATSSIDPKSAHNAIAGNIALLIDGVNKGGMGPRHPRSAVGITRDGRHLLLVTIDGRQRGYSEGTTDAETAEWLRRLGAWQGLNLDGGGSTTLVVEGTDGKPLVLNRPSGRVERRVANHLGVYARRR
jgi:exopolysaccharide biosynthesis protein